MNGTRIWMLGGGFAIIAVLGLGWLLGVSPLLAQASATNDELAGVTATNSAQAVVLAAMKDQFESLDDLQDELVDLRVSIPGRVDADYVYALLSSYQLATGVVVKSITTGDAVQYGVPIAGPGEAPAEGAPAAPTASGSLASSLFTVPVTITFDGASSDAVFAFVHALQTGPRLFLVTGVTGGGGAETGSTTITAYMFVVYDPSIGALVPGTSGSPDVEPAPDPEVTAEPTPTPTESPAP